MTCRFFTKVLVFILFLTCVVYPSYSQGCPTRFNNLSDVQNFMQKEPLFKNKYTGCTVRLKYSQHEGFLIYVDDKLIGKMHVEWNPAYPTSALLGLPWLNGYGPAPMGLILNNGNPILQLFPVEGQENLSYNSRGYLQPGRTNNKTWMELSLGKDGVAFRPVNYKPEPETFIFVEFHTNINNSELNTNSERETHNKRPTAAAIKVDVSNCITYEVERDKETLHYICKKLHIPTDTLGKYNPYIDWDRLSTSLEKGTKIYYPNPRKNVNTNISPLTNIRSITYYEATKKAPFSYRLDYNIEIYYKENGEPISWKRNNYEKGVLKSKVEINKDGEKFSHIVKYFNPDSIAIYPDILSNSRGQIGVIFDYPPKKDCISGFAFIYDDNGILIRKARIYYRDNNPIYEKVSKFNTYKEWTDFVDNPSNFDTDFYVEYNKNGDYYLTYADIPHEFDDNGNQYFDVVRNGKTVKNGMIINNYLDIKKKTNLTTLYGSYQYPIPSDFPTQWIGLFSTHEEKVEDLDPKIFSINYVYDSNQRVIEEEILKLGKPFKKIVYEYWN